MKAFLLAGLGSFLGGGLRYLIIVAFERKGTFDFPIAILAINAVGSFMIGLMTPGFERYSLGGDSAASLILSVGLMGGFTTFSTFSLQTLKLMQNGHWALALFNALASVCCCLISVWGGLRLGQLLFR